ncbi:phenylacetic acid degradation operon negative regulatory protein PaaX [Sneathiella glossodoripedis]|uniref:phenylacetic acid degradation operon negative regulatory protein PaaX n=1 Tax=Sneathiella glossodoripedis TaxID=418853 RepID=UPI00056121E6|nr:phenylacetic acid degradation operon negative regulatory protein PaaX [Sneathiella glossodoripedis]
MGGDIPALTRRLSKLPEQLNLKARSLLVTIWGDSIAPHGGTVWLGSLIDLVDCLGLNERAVRTSVFRLKNDQLLSSVQRGRKSYYTLTKSGQHRFEEATKRIYNHLPQEWDGEWTLLFSERRKLNDDQKRQLAIELGWLGFGDLGAGIFAHPQCPPNRVAQLVEDLGVQSHVTFIKGAEFALTEEPSAHIVVQKGWNLEEIEKGYSDFIAHFEPIETAIKKGETLSDQQAFVVRTLLVHDYRRALLRDPMLPETLLPENWHGMRARDLFHDIYQRIWQQAEIHLMQVLKTIGGPLPAASADFEKRFGGLMGREEQDG